MFSHIYEHNIWGDFTPTNLLYSGSGSHDLDIVDPYVQAVRTFISHTFSTPLTVADIGCGDFNVGRQIRNLTDHYTACDIVPGVIDQNRLAFADEDVDFQVLDIVTEELPAAELVFVRQVLQHLNNERILSIVPKLYQYSWAIITEHLPFEDPFPPNLDIPTGSVRIAVNSGVELVEAPFNLVSHDSRVLCEVLAKDGRIRTTAYRLRT